MEYQLPDVFVKLPVDDSDEFDHWEHTRGGYRVRIAKYYDAPTCFWWVGPVSQEVPNVYLGEWTEAPNLEAASKQAWHAFCIFADMDRAFGPANG